MDTTNLVAYLPFNESVTQDLLGNAWTAYGTPTIENGAVHLPSGAYLTANNIIDLNSDKWTFSCRCYCVSRSGDEGFFGLGEGANRRGIIAGNDGIYVANPGGGSWQARTSTLFFSGLNQWVHLEVDKDGTSLKFFCDGVLVWQTTINGLDDNGVFIIGGNSYGYTNDLYFKDVIFYDGVALHTTDFTPPTADDYDDLEMAITGLDYVTRTVVFDVERKVRNAPKLIEQLNKLKVYLPFDESPLDDWCGNVWTVNGSPTIEDSKLKLPGNSSYLAMDGGITLGGQDFTIRGKFNMSSAAGSWSRVFEIFNTAESSGDAIHIFRRNTSGDLSLTVFDTTSTTAITLDRECDFELDYSHAEGKVRFFLDGVLKITLNKTISQTTFANFYLGRSNYSADGYFVGTIDEFQIFDGVALHSQNFTPLTDEFYADLKNALADSAVYAYKIDVETKIRNAPRADVDSGISFTGGNNSYATIPREIFTGSSEFTIEIEFSTTTTRDDSYYVYHPIIIGWDNTFNRDQGVNLRLRGGNLVFWETNANTDQNYINTGKFVADGNPHKVAVVSNSDGSLDIYCDGELISHTENFNAVLTSGSYNYSTAFAGNWNSSANGNDMTLYESRFWSKSLTAEELFADISGDEENLEAWYVPTEKGLLDYTSNMRNATITGTTTYIEFETVFVDVEYESKNDALAWRYEDCAVYFGTGAPIQFHVPKAYELWIRFDVYFDGVARWYAYDDGIFGMTGITALTTLELDYLSAGAIVKSLPDVCKAKQTQTFLLHMISDATNGLIEVWAGLEQLESYYGNVNNGRPFVDFVLRSDEAGTSFTELIISNTRLEPDEKPANVVRATKTSQLNTCNTETGVIWLEPGGDYPFPYITYTIREVIRQTIKETIDIGEGEFKPVKSIWAKFDIFNDGINRWWFYNLNETFGRSGVCALTNGDMNFVANEVEVQQETDVCAIGQWQTFIIHMESDEINGLIEVMTGDETYTYTGNVNGGEEFTDIYLLSEGDKVVFDNFIVSTAPLDFDSSKRMNTPKRTTTLAFVVRHYDEDVVVPFYFSAVPILNAVAIRWLGCDWYNPLVLPDDANASPIPIRYGGVDYVLSVPT